MADSDPKPIENAASQDASQDVPETRGNSGLAAKEPIKEQVSPGVKPEPLSPPAPAVKTIVTEFPKLLAAVGGVLAATTALITAINGATWLKKETPTPLPTAIVTITASPSPSTTPTIISVPMRTDARAPVTQAEPTTMPTALPVSYLMDDFGSGGWEIVNDENWGTAFVDGKFQISLWTPQMDAWISPISDNEFADFRVDIDAHQVKGAANAYFGVIVRRGVDGFYVFAIADDGMYIVLRQDKTSLTELTDWATSAAIHQNGQTNHITVECLGEHLHFSANGQPLVEIVDDTYSSGTIGLLVGTYDQDLIVAQFDNLRLQVIDRF